MKIVLLPARRENKSAGEICRVTSAAPTNLQSGVRRRSFRRIPSTLFRLITLSPDPDRYPILHLDFCSRCSPIPNPELRIPNEVSDPGNNSCNETMDEHHKIESHADKMSMEITKMGTEMSVEVREGQRGRFPNGNCTRKQENNAVRRPPGRRGA
ncbi:hypothetical protein EVAR_57950_1 [Eumeta japonica]|uniref:Uncharacterized protein n=1 Tax=Eumeta variegata TaxID=151549 RepID=A0A4C1Y0C9_EUMVA|nr:hypothetical protein EVAR_57950_1 [Eumeta japonica]